MFTTPSLVRRASMRLALLTVTALAASHLTAQAPAPMQTSRYANAASSSYTMNPNVQHLANMDSMLAGEFEGLHQY